MFYFLLTRDASQKHYATVIKQVQQDTLHKNKQQSVERVEHAEHPLWHREHGVKLSVTRVVCNSEIPNFQSNPKSNFVTE